ncbi:MAG: hypothetical protein HC880_14245 [Bacteroidia bacterium]|nr:hypothetical protein [Bacteroidia bacterium]
MMWIQTLLMACLLGGQPQYETLPANELAGEVNRPLPQPNEDIWKTLLRVHYTYNKNTYIPQFDDNIKALDGKIVTIKGFMYPLDEALKHEFFMLSYYPINVCFFCGGAGPESVVEVNAKTPIRMTDKPVTLRGKLKLNANDRERLFTSCLGLRWLSK